tara:strand:+ start:416 stop:682 length:267 start_codon:yes stop_codon:yes gene_type:complete
MNDKDRVQEFIIKATGKTIGRNSKESLSILFANTYAEYVKAIRDINNGYKLYKEKEDKINRIGIVIKDLENVPTSVIKEIIDDEDAEA